MSDDLYDFAGLAASLEEALAAVLGARRGGRRGRPAARPSSSSLPPRREQGDVTTNAALVNAKRAAPRAARARASGSASAGWRPAAPRSATASRSPAPAFSTSSSTTAWYRGAVQRMLDAGDDYGRGVVPDRAPPPHQRRVRERQPRRPAARRQRALRRDGRRALPPLRVRRPRRGPRVLRQRRRHAR